VAILWLRAPEYLANGQAMMGVVTEGIAPGTYVLDFDVDGLITFELTPGIYALDIPDVEGHDDWGRFNHNLPGGGMYKVILTLGRLVVETWNPDGTLATNKYVPGNVQRVHLGFPQWCEVIPTFSIEMIC
jgi:hypothetical protein